MRNVLLVLFSLSCLAATVPVRDACGEDGSVVAIIQPSDAIRVEHGVVGESVPCYAVTLQQGGKTVRGYVSDATLPDIVEFERKRATESRVPIPEPPPAPAPAPGQKKPSEPRPTGPLFEPWSGADFKGRRLEIGGGSAKVTLVTFWSAESAAGRKAAETLARTGDEFRAKGLQAIAMVQPISPAKLGMYLDDMSMDCPVAYDRQGLAAKYGASPAKGTTLVIDSSNHIVAASANAAEIRAMVTKLLSSE